MAVFGSFVRGQERIDSDVDVAVEFDKTKPKSLDLIRLEDELSSVFNRKVDLGVYSSLNPHVADDVKKEMRVIYEKG
ncbi:MAG: nucleotidyltransferase domain-containing protein [Candidatus Bathyarchaeota archaeon]|nr:nucleotidyltransferase domain-containing protein [Candidatus Bathyarchaeota archaeon]